MKWIKPPEDLVRRFDQAVASFPKAEKRKMFGYPSLFVEGNLTAELFEDQLMLRLSEKDRAEFLRLPGARLFEPMPGRPMRQYVEAPESVVNDSGTLGAWLRSSVAFALTLKPKPKKARGGGSHASKKKKSSP